MDALPKLKYAAAVTHMKLSEDLDFVLGDLDSWCEPQISTPFCIDVLDCISEMSKTLLRNKQSRNYRDG